MASAATVLLGATISMDLAFTATIWNPAVSVAFVKIAIRRFDSGIRALRHRCDWSRPPLRRGLQFRLTPPRFSWPRLSWPRSRSSNSSPAHRWNAAVDSHDRRSRAGATGPILHSRVLGTQQAAPTRFLASVGQSLGPEGHLRLLDAGHSLLFAFGWLFANPEPERVGVVVLLAGFAFSWVRHGRDMVLMSTTVAPLLCAWFGFSLWQGNYDNYWYLPLGPCVAVAAGLGFTTYWPGRRRLPCSRSCWSHSRSASRTRTRGFACRSTARWYAAARPS
jgi:hypothetical protein